MSFRCWFGHKWGRVRYEAVYNPLFFFLQGPHYYEYKQTCSRCGKTRTLKS